MIVQVIQRQVQLGDNVTFSLNNGNEASGVLIELGRDHLSLENNEGTTTILIGMIGSWKVLRKANSEPEPMTALTNDRINKKSIALEKTYPHIPSTLQANAVEPNSGEIEKSVFKKLVEIESHFQARLQTATIQLKVPDFVFPAEELRGPNGADAVTRLHRITDKYKYALKINELSAKFGRIQPITTEIATLSEHFPRSSSLKRHLAYLNYLIGKNNDSITALKDALAASQDKTDWYNLAVLALKIGKNRMACYALEQVFQQVYITDELDAWHVYLGLLKDFQNWPALGKIIKNDCRKLLEKDLTILLETGIYLLKTTGKDEAATNLVERWIEGQISQSLAMEAFNQLDGQPSEAYQQIVNEFTKKNQNRHKKFSVNAFQEPQGFIYAYKKDRNFGFLNDLEGNKYFFHRSAVVDTFLYAKLDDFEWGHKIPVVFETAQGPKGPLALRLALFRTIDEIFDVANDSAKDGDYARAINYIRQVLTIDPTYPEANQLAEKWREYARETGVPRGSNPYARAKRVQLIEKDLDRASELFREAIAQGDNVESAIKDLANLIAQQGHPKKAIDFLQKNRSRIHDQQSVDNILILFYQNTSQYEQAVNLLRQKINSTSDKEKKSQNLWQIANCYLRQEDYSKAKRGFEEILNLHPDNLAARRNIAICYFKQQQLDEAERILNDILDTSPDAKAAELLEAITQAKTTGKSTQVDEIIIDTTLADFSGEISNFSQFFLERCEFQGVPPDQVQAQKFNRNDIKTLEGLATQLGTRRPRDRGSYYLSAAKIVSIVESESSDQFYRYLGRSFASSGDAAIAESKPLDSARELYCEALSVYDKDRSRRKDEQDAVNALVRFLYSTLGQTHVPLTPKIPSIDESIEQVLSLHPRRDRAFDAIAYLVLWSRYAANRVLRRLYSRSSLQAMAVEYLDNQGVSALHPTNRFEDFVNLWNELRRRGLDDWRAISSEFRFLSRIELTTSSLEASIERLKTIDDRLFFDLDQERSRQLQTIFRTILDLVKQISFEEQERLCIQINSRCEDLLGEIEGSPTKLSVEELYPVVETVQNGVKKYLEELYASSIPELELRLPLESHVPDKNSQIEVQIAIGNKVGRSPAESLELIVQEDESLFTVNAQEIRLDESLRGDEQRILILPIIQVTEHAIQSQTFSLPMYAQYRTRSGETEQTEVHSFSVRLYPEEEFETIDNPYATYAEGGVVGDPTMFYGRDELICNITKAIQESRSQSKSIVVFGQKRAGKSSILHHLKRNLKMSEDLIVLDLGNIGSILDEQSSTSLLYQIIWSIIRKLAYAIEDMVEDRNFIPLGLTFPSDTEFYSHPSPLLLFKDLFDKYKHKASKTDGWQNLRVVLLIDEFSYIYGLIMGGCIPDVFMKNWKALLQENYFSVVLAGQDVMPKFKQHFPNEFGTTQDERVSYLKHKDAVKLIDEPIRIDSQQAESRYRERAIELIVDLTAGSPFYIQIICDRLVKYMNDTHTRLVTEANVEQIKNELIRGVNALSLDKFDNLINSGDTSEDAISDEDARKVLRAIALNSQTGPCNRNSITCETDRPVDVILEDLVNREVIERERERYYQIRVGLFKDWLIAH